ncbi:MAG: Sarcosine oxidase, gamma subunit family [Pseudomonadota bacterium]
MAATDFNAGPVSVRKMETLVVIALRHLPEADAALVKALRAVGISAAPDPGQVLGQNPWALWRSPSEVILLATHRNHADSAAAAMVDTPLACAVDQTDGVLALELQGPQLDDLLLRLVDSRSLPRSPGTASRARLADITITLVRHESDRLWMLAERPQADYLMNWLKHAGAALEP